VYFEDKPRGRNLQVLKARRDEPIIVLDVKTGMRCTPHFAKSYILSRDNSNGEMHIPAICNGKAAEFVWHLDGEFTRYLGVRYT
jgi:hypothetical protein